MISKQFLFLSFGCLVQVLFPTQDPTASYLSTLLKSFRGRASVHVDDVD